MREKNNRIIVILGPTSGGKTKLAVWLAQKFNGEIVSADSRQVYKGMDIGTGKDLEQYIVLKKQKSKKAKKQFAKIPYHLIDIVSPKTEFNLAKYQKLAYKAIDDILMRGKLPIIAGGTGLYIQAVVDGYQLSDIKPDKKLRAKLEKMTTEKLFAMLKKIDLKKANGLNESEQKNKRRLIRHIEIMQTPRNAKERQGTPNFNALLIGLTFPKEVLEKRIYKRLVERLEKENMIGEVKRLRKNGVSWKKLEGFGLEYKYISLYLRGKLAYNEMVNLLNIASRQFAKRQMTWFKLDERIKWITKKQEAEKLVGKFLF